MATKKKPAPIPDILGALSVEDEGHLDHEGKIWIVDERGLCVAELESNEEAIIGPKAALRNAELLTLAPLGVELARLIEAQFGEAIQTGEEINGGDAVDFITQTLYPLALDIVQRNDEAKETR